jgi:NADH:ubiquinone oxidoreductase subunit E
MSEFEKVRYEVTEENLDAVIQAAVEHHGDQRDALIPILQEVNQAFGYIPAEALGKIRRRINAPEEGLFLADSHLFAIASFYQMFSLKPTGKHIIRFCESAPCHVVGGRQVIQALKDWLKIEPGETTPDKRWTLLQTSCLGLCAVGPVFMVDDDIYGNVRPEQVPAILFRYREK